MTQIDYYLFPLSPFTYLAGDGLEKVAAKNGATINYKPFGLMKVFEETGTAPLPKRHPSRLAYRLQEIARISDHTGLPVNPQPAFFPTNPVPACTAIISAQEDGSGDVGGLVRSILRACWAEEKNIAEDDVIAQAMTENGFDPAIANAGMLSATQVLERNTEDALAAQVFGAPSYVVDDQVFWGQDRLDYLDRYLAK